jgi:integrase
MSATFDKRSEARSWSSRLESEIKAGRFRAPNPHLVRDLVERYIATVVPHKKTGARTAQQLRAWSELIGEHALEDLRPAAIATARDRLAETRGPATVVRYLSALSHAFTIAVKDWQWVESNPVKRITWPRQPRGRVRFLSEDEREALITAAADSKCIPLVSIIMLALLTGMRRGEILNLKWHNVDLERHRLILTDTKNKERRQVPLVPTAYAIVRSWKCGEISGNAYIFHKRGATDIPVRIDRHFKRAVRVAGLTDFRFHDLRHTAASYLAMTGATTNEIAEILGHKTLDMVKRYAHLTTTHSAKVLERMESEIYTAEKREP